MDISSADFISFIKVPCNLFICLVNFQSLRVFMDDLEDEELDQISADY